MINNQLLVTIAIPFYNGFNQINHILTELYTPNIHNYEILIIDDNSIESESIGLKDLIKLKYKFVLSLIYIYKHMIIFLKPRPLIFKMWNFTRFEIGEGNPIANETGQGTPVQQTLSTLNHAKNEKFETESVQKDADPFPF